ncbi:MAG: Maf family protein [Bifidobacteriaceae bacterium]|nr:Maf family protein [Bifidobacteriaceae bacterium]
MSVPIILASQSVPRRNVLAMAGVIPTVRASFVDEPQVLRKAARSRNVQVDQLPINERVMILAQAKAQAVFESYKTVVNTAERANGVQVVALPLEADLDSHSDLTDDSTITRDFSGVEVPTRCEDLHQIQQRASMVQSGVIGPLIIGCDSLFLFDGVCQGKPHTPDVARERLRSMRGKSGELWTGHCVIDMASGRTVCGTSHATVQFGTYSDRDIERYIATEEPLEVAGTFTLEGLGGAFIDSIEGDPHGVIGVSLAVLRSLFTQLGVDWTDAWNAPSTVHEMVENHQESGTTSNLIEKIHQPGDGWVECACGRKHWGLHGASGILLARRNSNGDVTHVVMQHRAMWSAEGGTWGIPGGATADGESPAEGALRESFEEANINPEDIDIVGSYCEDHGPWSYTTFFAFEKDGHQVSPHANDDESMEIAWVAIEDVPQLKLLTAMKTDWPRFEQRLCELAQQYK